MITARSVATNGRVPVRGSGQVRVDPDRVEPNRNDPTRTSYLPSRQETTWLGTCLLAVIGHVSLSFRHAIRGGAPPGPRRHRRFHPSPVGPPAGRYHLAYPQAFPR